MHAIKEHHLPYHCFCLLTRRLKKITRPRLLSQVTAMLVGDLVPSLQQNDTPQPEQQREAEPRGAGEPCRVLTGFRRLILAVPQQLKDVHLHLGLPQALGRAVDAVLGQGDGEPLPPAALHGVIQDGSCGGRAQSLGLVGRPTSHRLPKTRTAAAAPRSCHILPPAASPTSSSRQTSGCEVCSSAVLLTLCCPCCSPPGAQHPAAPCSTRLNAAPHPSTQIMKQHPQTAWFYS